MEDNLWTLPFFTIQPAPRFGVELPSQECGLDIKAFLRSRQAEKTTDFAIIAAYCGFGTFV
jgi:hypothetical protein